MQFERPLTSDELASLRSMVKRRVTREPLQYILGGAEFYGRSFRVRPGVLIPRPETEVLVEEVLRRTEPLRVLDVGTGSGCIAITIALERPTAEVIAIDVSKEALQIARENASRLDAHHVEFRMVDLFDDDGIADLGTFDLVVSNPPYVADEERTELEPEISHEPEIALFPGEDGLKYYRRIVDVAPRILRKEGEIFVELGFGQRNDVESIFESAGFETRIYNDLEGHERILRAFSARERPSPFRTT
jgi:release factor glutamine methyltransferase